MRENGGEDAPVQESSIEIVVEKHLGWMTFNNPARHNALTQAMWLDLPGKIKALEENHDVRAIILRGAGDRAFCAGADISEFNIVRRDAATARKYEAANVAAFAAIRTCTKPVIAMIQGHCIGGGFGIAAACDLRFASEEAGFSVPAARLGLAYPIDALFDIINAVGEQSAKEILLSARKFSAEEIHVRGFLAQLCKKDELLPTIIDIGERIAENAPATLLATKLTILGLHSGDMSKAMDAADATFESKDYAEGRAAFQEKRKPRFTGE